ncbi:MAG TPA: peptidylprolyl isomerase [Bryobacteraceae bacterium]|nr:peptidylprolyl isomerase [Bryobacteraceae bacterium]
MRFSSAILALYAITAFAQIPVPSARPQPAPAPAAPAAPAEPNKVILTIGDQKITEAEFTDLINALPQQYQEYARGPGKRSFAEQLVQVKVLSDEAAKQKLDQDPKIRTTLAYQRDTVLAQAMFVELQNHVKVDNAAVEKYYNDHKNEYEVLKARHILIRVKDSPAQGIPGKKELTDAEALAKAQDIRKRLVAGEDFATLAKAESDDVGSGSQGGDVGEFHKGMMVPPFEEAAFAAKVNDFTEPVKTPFGYHVIQVESHVTKPIAEVRPEIEKKLRPDLARVAVESLAKGASVHLDDAFFGAAPAAGAAPGGVSAPK